MANEHTDPLRDELLVFMGEQRAMNTASLRATEAYRERIVDMLAELKQSDARLGERIGKLEHWRTGIMSRIAGVAAGVSATVTLIGLVVTHTAK